MKNAQKPETFHLGKLIKEIKKGHFIIPDFQREFDWKPWDVNELIKSIFLDYYIGSLLLWEADKTNVGKLSCEPLFAFEGKTNPEFIVLDGQQRLTALHYALFKPEKAFKNRKTRVLYYIDIHELSIGSEDSAFAYSAATKHFNKVIASKNLQYEHCYMPISLLGEGLYEIEKWFKEFNAFWKSVKQEVNEEDWEDEEETFEEYINRVDDYLKTSEHLNNQIEELLDSYEISYISLSKNLDIGKVCEIFTHINQRGLKLDTFDLLNAITRPKDIFLKQMYRDASKRLEDTSYPGFEMKSQILMVMSILEQNYCSPKYLYYLVPGETKKIKNDEGDFEDVVLIENSSLFKDKWGVAVNAIRKALNSLRNARDYGAIKSSFLPYPSIIPALASIKHYVENNPITNKVEVNSKIKKWYWASIFGSRYSSSVESTSAKDFIDLKKWLHDEDAEPECVTDFYREYANVDLKRETRNSSAMYKAIFNLFILNEARDWETFELPEYDSLDDHHIVPKSWGKKNDLPVAINSILNRSPLSSNTNRNIINDSLPNEYLKQMFGTNNESKVYETLQSHLISKKAVSILLKDPFTKEDYNDFIVERKKTILQEIENRILKEKRELPEHLKLLDEEIENLEINIRNVLIEGLSLESIEDLKKQLPQHVLEKMQSRISRERKRNPAHVQDKYNEITFWMQFSDFQELQQIITNKNIWPSFEILFGNKEKLSTEFNDVANLRNSIRHSREIDEITKMKGQASILWFKQQINGSAE